MKTNFFTLSFFLISALVCSTQKTNAQNWLTAGNNLVGGEKLGSLNNFPLNIVTNNTSRIFVAPNGRVGIGTATPVNLLTVRGSGSTPASSWLSASSGAPLFTGFTEGTNNEHILASATSSANQRPIFFSRRSRGTLAAPLAVVNNDYLASLLASGYDGSAFQNPAGIDFYVDAVPAAGSVPTRVSLVTGSNSGNRKERLRSRIYRKF